MMSLRFARPISSSISRFAVLARSLSTETSSSSMEHSFEISPTRRTHGLGKNVWVEFSSLAAQFKPVNLGQGMPDYPPPQFLVDGLVEASKSPHLHQYTRGAGHPRLVNALGKLYGRFYDRELDPMTNILVTVGAYSALSHAFNAFIQEGDEVIIIEPYFDCYSSMTQYCGGKPVYVPLRPTTPIPESSGDWVLDKEELESAFTDKTKMVVVTTPNNPLGKVFSRSELEMLSELCVRHNVLCVSDEVYEWLVYPPMTHTKIATLPGMWERTITIGSAGKTFHTTGWKTGWTVAPAHLIKPMHICLTEIYYTHTTLLQEAIAVGLETEIGRFGQSDSYLVQTNQMMQEKRDVMCTLLKEAGLRPIVPQGGYFVLADTSSLGLKFDTEGSDKEPYDFQLAKWMIKEKGIASIPPSVFFGPDHKHISGKLIRFCFCKDNATLEKSKTLLQQLSN